MRRVLPLLAVLLMGAAFAPVPPYRQELRAMIELKMMQGTWAVTSRFADGSTLENRKRKVEINGDRKLRFGSEQVIQLDPSKSPKEWNATWVRGGNPNLPPTFRAIYKLEGDTLTLRYRSADPFSGRPKSFERTSRDEVDIVMTRVQP